MAKKGPFWGYFEVFLCVFRVCGQKPIYFLLYYIKRKNLYNNRGPKKWAKWPRPKRSDFSQNMSNKIPWSKIYQDFRQRYPRLRKEVHMWEAYDYLKILIHFKDGSKLVYDYLLKTGYLHK